MNLNEFADPKVYALPVDDMAEQLERVCAILADDSPLIPVKKQAKGIGWMNGDGIRSIAGYIGGSHSPGVRNSPGEFPTSQPNAANFPFHESTYYFCPRAQSSSDGSSGVAMVTSASPEFRMVM